MRESLSPLFGSSFHSPFSLPSDLRAMFYALTRPDERLHETCSDLSEDEQIIAQRLAAVKAPFYIRSTFQDVRKFGGGKAAHTCYWFAVRHFLEECSTNTNLNDELSSALKVFLRQTPAVVARYVKLLTNEEEQCQIIERNDWNNGYAGKLLKAAVEIGRTSSDYTFEEYATNYSTNVNTSLLASFTLGTRNAARNTIVPMIEFQISNSPVSVLWRLHEKEVAYEGSISEWIASFDQHKNGRRAECGILQLQSALGEHFLVFRRLENNKVMFHDPATPNDVNNWSDSFACTDLTRIDYYVDVNEYDEFQSWKKKLDNDNRKKVRVFVDVCRTHRDGRETSGRSVEWRSNRLPNEGDKVFIGIGNETFAVRPTLRRLGIGSIGIHISHGRHCVDLDDNTIYSAEVIFAFSKPTMPSAPRRQTVTPRAPTTPIPVTPDSMFARRQLRF